MTHITQLFEPPQRKRPRRQPQARDRHWRGLLIGALCFGGSLWFAAVPALQQSTTPQKGHFGSVLPGLGSASASAQTAPVQVAVAQSGVLRSRPSNAGRITTQVRSGDTASVLDEQRGDDGNLWYYLDLTNQPRRGWIPADQVTSQSGAPVWNPQPSSAPATLDSPAPRQVRGQTTPSNEAIVALPNPQSNRRTYDRARQALGLPDPPPLPTQRSVTRNSAPPSLLTNPSSNPQPPVQEVSTNLTAAVNPAILQQNQLTDAQLQYFLEIALGSELGGGNSIRRWDEDLRILVRGNPTQQDLATLRTVADELNALLEGRLQLEFVERNPNVEMFFAPESQFRQIEPNYRPRNMGFFWTRWDNNGINTARILISTTGVTQPERSHLIREELTQILGLMRDSYRYDDSMFYQGWTEVGRYSDMDRALIQLLYSDAIRHGMNRQDVLRALSRQ